MDPFNLRISEITDEFIGYVNEMERFDIEITSDFLVMASTLMEIKSKMLLAPEPEIIEKQNEIARKLYEYSLMKEAAEKMDEMYKIHSLEFNVKVTSVEDFKRSEELPKSFWQILRTVEKEIGLRKKVYRISRDSYSIPKKLEELKVFAVEKGILTLREIILKSRDRLEAVVTFVAVLELLRLKFLTTEFAKGEVFLYVNGDDR